MRSRSRGPGLEYRAIWRALVGFFLLAASLYLAFPARAMAPDTLRLALEREGVDPDRAALVIVRLEDDCVWAVGGARTHQQFVPASTAKIPHTLLAFEAGVVSGPDQLFAWDGRVRSVPGWNEDQTLAQAFGRSTVWVYQRVVSSIGAKRLRDGLKGFDYGNADIGSAGDLERYWLAGPLAISASEQVAFLTRLVGRTLPVSPATYDRALPLMRLAQAEGWALSGKTGMAQLAEGTDLGWFVGWLEQSSGQAPGTYVFALNMDMPAGMEDAPKRRAAVERALQHIGALP